MGLLTLLAVAAVLVVVVGTGVLIRHITRPPRKTLAVALARELPTDPAALGLEFEQIDFTFDDRSTTPGWIIQGDQVEGPTVVVTHGFGDSRYGALTWAPLLVPFASRIVIYDVRAHGDSTARTSTSGLIEASDLVQILNDLTSAGIDAPIVLFGYSAGAGVSIATAVDGPSDLKQRIIGVIGDGTYRLWSEPIAQQMWRRGWPPYPFTWLASVVFELRFGGVRTFDRARQAARLKCPLLLLHGSEDFLCPVTSARQIAEAAPDSQLVVFDGGSHTDLAHVDPVRYADALHSFFERIVAQCPIAEKVCP